MNNECKRFAGEREAFEAAVEVVNERGWASSTDLARQIWQLARTAQPAPVVPEGYRLVPVEATTEMVRAAVREADRQESLFGYDGSAFWRAMLAAAPAQGQQVERWIPVSERLPEPFTVVALLDENRWMNTGCDDFEANWTGAGWLWANGINDNGMYWSAIGERHGLTMDSVTHWMPLPAAPTQGGDV